MPITTNDVLNTVSSVTAATNYFSDGNLSALLKDYNVYKQEHDKNLQKKYDALFAFVCVLLNNDDDENIEAIFDRVKKLMSNNKEDISSMAKRIERYRHKDDEEED